MSIKDQLPLFLFLLQFSIYHLLKGLLARALHHPAGHEDRRSSADACLLTVCKVPVDDVLDCSILNVLVELLYVQPELPGDLLHLCIIERRLVLVDLLMKLPELSLPARCQCSRRSLTGKGVVRQRVVLHDKLHILGIFLQHLPEERFYPRAVRSLIIAEDRDRDGCILRPSEIQPLDIDLLDEVDLDDLEYACFTARQDQ